VAAIASSANKVHPIAAEERLSMSKHRVCLTVVVIHAVFTRDANRLQDEVYIPAFAGGHPHGVLLERCAKVVSQHSGVSPAVGSLAGGRRTYFGGWSCQILSKILSNPSERMCTVTE
jgi:hypothetical protein